MNQEKGDNKSKPRGVFFSQALVVVRLPARSLWRDRECLWDKAFYGQASDYRPVTRHNRSGHLFQENERRGTLTIRLKFYPLMFRAIFWVILPCKMIDDRRFRGAYCLHHQGWTIILHGSITQKTALNIILAAVRTWNLTFTHLLLIMYLASCIVTILDIVEGIFNPVKHIGNYMNHCFNV
jgi:hypothetical protein